MYERFTDRARKVMQLANQEAQRFNYEYIAPEHILLGLIKEGSGVGCLAIKNLDGDLGKLRLETEKLLQSNQEIITMGKLPMTSRARKIIETSEELRGKLEHDHIGTEHLLLALLGVEDSVAFTVLQKCEIRFAEAEEAVLAILGSNPESEDHPVSTRLAYREHVKRKKERHRKLKSLRDEKRKKKRAPAPRPYEQYTDRSRKVLRLANEEVQRFNHEYIGTEHILLGLVKEGSGVASSVLKNLDVDLRKVRLEVEKLVQSGPEMISMGKMPFTPRAKNVLGHAAQEAENLNHQLIGTEHLLLGLIREEDGVASQVLTALGLSLEQIRSTVLDMSGQGTPEQDLAARLPAPLANLQKIDLIALKQNFPRPIELDKETLTNIYVGLTLARRSNVFLIGPKWLTNEYFEKLGTDAAVDEVPLPLKSASLFQVDHSVRSLRFSRASVAAIYCGTQTVFCFNLRPAERSNESRTFFLNSHQSALESNVVKFVIGGQSSDWEQLEKESPELANLFTAVKLGPLSAPSISDIVRLASEDLELQHAVSIPAESVAEALKLGKDLSTQLELPNAAIVLLDHAAAYQSLMATDRNSELNELLLKYHGLLSQREEAMRQGDFKLAKSQDEELASLRKEYLKTVPEAEQPIVKPDDIRIAFDSVAG